MQNRSRLGEKFRALQALNTSYSLAASSKARSAATSFMRLSRRRS